MNYNRNVQAVLFLVCLAALYHLKIFENVFALGTSTVQYLLVVPVLLCFRLITSEFFRISGSCLVLAFFASLLMGFAHLQLQSGNNNHDLKIILSPFKADDSQVQSIKFQDLLKQDLDKKEYGISFSNVTNPVDNLKSAKQLLTGELKNTVLVAGTPRWLTIYFLDRQQPDSRYFEPFPGLKLQLVQNVRSIAFSDAMSAGSRQFISLLFRAQSALEKGNRDLAEVLLADAASVQSAWTSHVHRAYPLWLAGTAYLENTDSERINLKDIRCAIDYFNLARRFIHSGNSPELLTAILNNRGLAYYLSYTQTANKKHRKIALQNFKKAASLLKRRGDPEIRAKPKENYWRLSQIKKKVQFKNKKDKRNLKNAARSKKTS